MIINPVVVAMVLAKWYASLGPPRGIQLLSTAYVLLIGYYICNKALRHARRPKAQP